MRPIEAYTLVKQRQQRSRRVSRSFRRRAGRLGMGAGIILGVLLAASLAAAAAAYTGLTSNLPPAETLALLMDPVNGQLLQPSRLYDRSGQHLLAESAAGAGERRFLTVDEPGKENFSEALIRLAESAYPAHAFSLAALTDPAPQSLSEDLAGRLLLAGETPTLKKALRTRLLGWQISSRYTHREILAAYLNSLPFGSQAFGADAASRLYLGKNASQVNLAEAALLTAVSETPALNPLDAPQAARGRQQAILYQLAERSALPDPELRQALDTSLEFALPAPAPVKLGAAFAAHALEQMELVLGRDFIQRGGLVILTSMDYDLQVQLECTLQTQLQRIYTGPGIGPEPAGDCSAARLLPTLPEELLTGEDLSASAAVLDPASGQILALASASALDGQTSHLQPHTAGSILHPFIYTAAFTHGLGPASLIWDAPTALPSGIRLPEPDGGYLGPVRLRQALASGLVTPAASLLEQTGSREVWHLASSFGFPENLPELAASGDSGSLFPWSGAHTSILDVLQAYGVFASGGILSGQVETPPAALPDPSEELPFTFDTTLQAELAAPGTLRLRSSLVSEVSDPDGRIILDWRQPRSQAVLTRPLAYLMNSILSDEAVRWPALGHPNPLETGRPAAALNGRGFAGDDVWTVGYTPERAVVVWVGRPPAASGTGAPQLDWRLSATLWNALIKAATEGLPASGWEMPPGVTRMDVCDPSGLLPNDVCPQVVSEVFLQGNEPTQGDTLYRKVQINRETGQLATIFTPAEMITEKVFIAVPPDLQAWAVESGFPQPPENYDTIQAPPALANAHFDNPEMFSTVKGMLSVRGTAAGENFAYYRLQAGRGINPQEWVQVGENRTEPVNSELLAEWDTTGLNGLYALRLTVVHNDQTIESAVLQVMVDNTPPRVEIIYPQAGQQIPAGQVIFEADISDSGGLSQVEWILDGAHFEAKPAGPFQLTRQLESGEHTLQVNAVDSAGNAALSPVVTFMVK